MARTVFVLGWEPFNAAFLHRMQDAGDYDFRPLLSHDEVVEVPYDVETLLAAARHRIAATGVAPDAVITYWDFPSSFLLPVLRADLGLPGPSLEAVMRCEHKYWSRVLQAQALPEMVPRFRAFDPFDARAVRALDLAFPIWVKPIKAHSSHLGFKVHDSDELDRVVAMIRQHIHVFGEPFAHFLRRADVPGDIAAVDGYHCLAEEIISQGRQCTLEGYTLGEDVEIYGIIDSVRAGRQRSSFARYQYPSRLPRHVTRRMRRAAERLVRHLAYRDGTFNVEFFWDPQRDDIKLLEINARISKSHCPLFYLVDGASHQHVAVHVALGERPCMPRRAGDYAVAAKFMLRRFADATVHRVPESDDIARLQAAFPDAYFHCLVAPGQRLAHLPLQDSYSFELAELFLGAESQRALLAKYRACLGYLPFQLEPAAAPVMADD